MKKRINIELEIQNLNDKGYGVATSSEGKECWVLNSLPGEKVIAEIFKKKKGRMYGKAIEIIEASQFRVVEKDEHFLSSSPWQILDLEKEIDVKKDLISDAMSENSVNSIDAFDIYSEDVLKSWGYRNKVEFGFYGDDDENIFVSFFMRGGNFGKYPLPQGDSLLNPVMNAEGLRIVEFLNSLDGFVARDFKSLILRHSIYEDKVIACLFVKNPDKSIDENLLNGLLSEKLKGIAVFYSNQNSPASIVSETRSVVGETKLTEKIGESLVTYDWDNFFQINVPVFSEAMNDIKKYIRKINVDNTMSIVDMYSGVGTIGIMLSDVASKIISVEICPGSTEKALYNASQNNVTDFKFIEQPSEKALEYINSDDILVLDPPRAGLHKDVVDKILEVKPKHIVYLSCNYQTQAENLSDLQTEYDIEFFKGYNFYPHTPHVETLAILKKK